MGVTFSWLPHVVATGRKQETFIRFYYFRYIGVDNDSVGSLCVVALGGHISVRLW